MPNKKVNWNDRYYANDTPWDKGAPAPILKTLLQEEVFPKDDSTLVPGCGRGYDVAELAEGGHEALGLDIAPLPISWAKNNIAHPSARFMVGDLFDPHCLPDQSFGAIWEHTCYCAILPAQRLDYVASAHRLLSEGGILAGVFFTDTEMPEGEGPPFETSRNEVVELFSPKFTLISERAPEKAYPGRENREWLMVWKKKMH